MCEICRSNPCKNLCPNAPPDFFGKCSFCKDEIEHGNRYFTDACENLFCSEDCVLEFYGIKERT